jgi:hypothetical protein
MAQYPIPPWLNVSPGDFGQAAARGAEISLGRQRIQQEAVQANQRAAQAAQELEARRKQEADNAQREAQQLEYQHAYQTAELGLKQQQQEQSEQAFQMEVKAAAQKSQAMLEYQRRYQAGEDPTKLGMELFPLMGMSGAGLASLAKKPPELGKVTPITLSDGRKVDAIRTGAGQLRIMAPPAAQTNINTVPVIGPHGEEIPGMFGAPGAGGAFRIHNIPKESGGEALNKIVEDRKARLAQTNTTATATQKPAAKRKPNADAIDHLKKHPETAKEFDDWYGDGEAEKIIGKQKPSAAPVSEPDFSQ